MNRNILRLAIPNILSNLSVPLLGMVDTALMGRLEDEVYLGAIGIGGIIFNFIYWGFGFLRMGTTGLTAQAYGKKDQQEITSLLVRGLLVAGSASVVLLLGQYPLVWVAFLIVEGGPEVTALAKEYVLIRIYAAPATIGLYVFHGWFLGMQNARYPMVLTILVNLMNIGCNMLFIYEFGMKSDGVAWGTVCAQYTGLLGACFLFWYKYASFTHYFSWSSIKNWEALSRFWSVNSDIFFRTISLVLVFSFFTSASAGMSALMLAGNQILLQFQHLMAYAVDGFAFAAESLVGRFRGEDDRNKLKEAIHLLIRWGLGFGGCFSLIYGLFGTSMLYLFTDIPEVIATAKPYLYWVVILPLVSAGAFIWDGIYIGATATKPMRNTVLLATFAIFFPLYYATVFAIENHALWLSLTVFMLMRWMFLAVLANKYIFFGKGDVVN